MKTDLRKTISDILKHKSKCQNLTAMLKEDFDKMSIEEINNFLKGVHCPYSYSKNAYFQVNEDMETNLNCTWATCYDFQCCGCDDECYLHWKNTRTYCMGSIVDLVLEVMECKGK